jgi:hypothetical protein
MQSSIVSLTRKFLFFHSQSIESGPFNSGSRDEMPQSSFHAFSWRGGNRTPQQVPGPASDNVMAGEFLNNGVF